MSASAICLRYGSSTAVRKTVSFAFEIKQDYVRISVTGVLRVCVFVCMCAHSHEGASFICACVHAGISLVSSLAGLVSAGLSIGQVDL